MAFIMALVMNFIGYWFSDKIALKMSGAEEVTMEQAPDLHARSSAWLPGRSAEAPRVCYSRRTPPMLSPRGENPNMRPWPSPGGLCGSSNPKNWKASWPTNSPTSRTATSDQQRAAVIAGPSAIWPIWPSGAPCSAWGEAMTRRAAGEET